MKMYNEMEVHDLIKSSISETIDGVIEWIEVDADIVDKDTKKKVKNFKISLESKPLLKKFIYLRLLSKGIIFSDNETDNL